MTSIRRVFSRLWQALSCSRKLALTCAGVVFAAALSVRLWAAPLSSGVDVPQFWAFARVFQDHGIDFYRYADASLDIFPVPGWRFVYPPVWLLTLGISSLFSPNSLATNELVSVDWRLAEKAPLIAADLAIGLLIYWAVSGSRWKKLLFASIWWLNPAAWYQSAVFGQFDTIAAAFMLGSILAFDRGRFKLAFVMVGLAVMTKQYMALPAVVIIAIYAREMGRRQALSGIAYMAGTAAVLSLPFLFTGAVRSYMFSLFAPGQAFDYGNLMMYIFSGTKSLAEYLHTRFGWETVKYLALDIPLMAAALGAAIWIAYRKPLSAMEGALAGLLIFIGLSYQVNYQYIIGMIPLAILAASRARKWPRVLLLALGLVPAAWLWLFDITVWFTSYDPQHEWVIPLFRKIGLVRYVPDYYYLVFALALMALCLGGAAQTLMAARKRGKLREGQNDN
ncbi:MAG: DUF2029 domain-containing protein [Chloroflexi bacterium]|nr:DUF2029 domain-containing protein [Chloroflexota bacterium]